MAIDNLGAYHVKGVAEMIHSADAQLRYLPVYRYSIGE